MFNSCGWNGWGNGINDSGPEVGAIYDAIQDAAAKTRVDHRFILATMVSKTSSVASSSIILMCLDARIGRLRSCAND